MYLIPGISGTYAYSPDREIIAIAAGNAIHFFASTGEYIHNFSNFPNTSSISCVAYSADGRILASSFGETIKLWEVATGREIYTLRGHTNYISSIAFSPDSQLLVSGSWDRTTRLWDVARSREIRKIKGEESIHFVTFSLDGQLIGTIHNSKIIILYRVADGREIYNINLAPKWAYGLTFTDDGRLLTNTEFEYTKLLQLIIDTNIDEYFAHHQQISSLAFSPNGKILASGSYDTNIKLWDVTTGKHISTLKSHTHEVASVAFSPKVEILASASYDKTVKLWEVATESEITTLINEDLVSSVAFSPNGELVAIASNNIKLWHVATGDYVRILETNLGRVNFVAFSPDGQLLASGNENGSIKLWQVATGREIATLHQARGYMESVFSLSFSPDGQILASGSEDTALRLWNIATCKRLDIISDGKSEVNAIAFSPDGQIFASNRRDNKIILREVTTNKEIYTLTACSDVHALAFSPDGKLLASGDYGGNIQIWQRQ